MTSNDFKVPAKLFGTGNSKTMKGDKYGYTTYIQHLIPAGKHGLANLCPYASPGCAAACLVSAGHGRFPMVENARINKTVYYTGMPAAYRRQLEAEIFQVAVKHSTTETKAAMRLNGTSDVNWTALVRKMTDELGEHAPTFYDYTKNPGLVRKIHRMRHEQGFNYHVIFSRDEKNDEEAQAIAAEGINVAVVFRKEKPDTWWGLPVIDGDIHDLRFLDPDGHVVALSAKGKAKEDRTGFVIDL